MNMKRNYTVVTCHFGNPKWINHCLSQIDLFSGDEVEGVVIVDQTRESQSLLEKLPRVENIIVTTPNHSQNRVLGHDHPAALDECLKDYSFKTERIVVLDSDCFPISTGWLDAEVEVQLAEDPHKAGLSHPCFMDIPTESRHSINFSDGCVELGIDTGRLVGHQLWQAGYDVTFLKPLSMFRGVRGHLYSEKIYHHGSASFTGHIDERLSRQVNKRPDKVLSAKVLKQDFSISFARVLFWKAETFLKNR